MAEDYVGNSSHILFSHPSCNRNNVLVNELLHGRKYGHWKIAVEMALICKTS